MVIMGVRTKLEKIVGVLSIPPVINTMLMRNQIENMTPALNEQENEQINLTGQFDGLANVIYRQNFLSSPGVKPGARIPIPTEQDLAPIKQSILSNPRFVHYGFDRIPAVQAQTSALESSYQKLLNQYTTSFAISVGLLTTYAALVTYPLWKESVSNFLGKTVPNLATNARKYLEVTVLKLQGNVSTLK
jgi:hypothetical protein